MGRWAGAVGRWVARTSVGTDKMCQCSIGGILGKSATLKFENPKCLEVVLVGKCMHGAHTTGQMNRFDKNIEF